MGTSTLGTYLRRLLAIAATLVAALAGCETDPIGPGTPHFAHLRVVPVLESAVDPALLDLDTVHVTVELTAGNLVDTSVAYLHSPGDTLEWVVDIGAAAATLMVRAQVLAAPTVMFAADTTLVLEEGPIGTGEVRTVRLPYAGPGGDVASLMITPGDSTITWGDTLRYGAVATNAAGTAVSDAIIIWSTSDSTIASIDRDALLQAPTSGRTSINVLARTPTGVEGSASLLFLPPPGSLIPLEGDGDTAAVASELSLAVRLLGSDGEPLASMPVRFGAPAGAAVADPVVMTDAQGVALTTATLGVMVGAYLFDATVAGLASVPLRTHAVAGPAAALFFTVQPSTTPVAEIIAPSVQVAIHDALGNLASAATDTVTLRFEGDPGGGTLLGTTRRAAVAGVASFDDLRVDAAGTAYRLAADAPGLASEVSNAFDVVQVPTSVTVTPSAAAIHALDATVALAATATDAAGDDIVGAEFDWWTSDSGVAAVDSAGLVTAVGNGIAQIVVMVGTVSDTAVVTVQQVVATVTMTPSAVIMVALTDTVRFAAATVDANGFPIPGATFTWSSSDPSVATIDPSGLVTSVGNGATLLVATTDGVSDTATVTVAQVVASLAVAPQSIAFMALQDTLRLAALGFDAKGVPVTAPSLTWESSDAAIAAVDGSGLVTAIGNGTALAIARADGAADTVGVWVEQEVASIVLVPNAVTLTALTEAILLDGLAFDANGFAVPAPLLTWSSSAPDVATVDTAGLVTSVDNGSAVVVASANGAADTTTVTVEQLVRILDATPDTVTLAALTDTVRLQVEALDHRQIPVVGATLEWVTEDPTVATVDPNGLVLSVDNGTTQIVVTADDQADTVQVVVQQHVVALELVPQTVTFSALLETLQLVASAYDAKQVPVDAPTLNWSSTDATIASVDSDGITTAIDNGSVLVVVRSDEAADTASVTVAQLVTTLSVVPAETTLTALGDTARLMAAAEDSNGQPLSDPELSWISLDPAMATVDDQGLVTAVGTGASSPPAAAAGQSGPPVLSSTGLPSARIVVSAGEISDTSIVFVEQLAVRVEIELEGDTLQMVSGEIVPLVARAYDANDNIMPDAFIEWMSADAAIATVSWNGIVTAIAPGTVLITARIDDASDSLVVSVEAIEGPPGN